MVRSVESPRRIWFPVALLRRLGVPYTLQSGDDDVPSFVHIDGNGVQTAYKSNEAVGTFGREDAWQPTGALLYHNLRPGMRKDVFLYVASLTPNLSLHEKARDAYRGDAREAWTLYSWREQKTLRGTSSLEGHRGHDCETKKNAYYLSWAVVSLRPRHETRGSLLLELDARIPIRGPTQRRAVGRVRATAAPRSG